ncbi:hypothetical protein ACFSLT_24815 [Novosphingobium resinovorum]
MQAEVGRVEARCLREPAVGAAAEADREIPWMIAFVGERRTRFDSALLTVFPLIGMAADLTPFEHQNLAARPCLSASCRKKPDPKPDPITTVSKCCPATSSARTCVSSLVMRE